MIKLIRYSALLALLAPFAGTTPMAVEAQVQQTQTAEVTDARLQVYARAFLDVTRVQDEFDPLLAAVRNKTTEAQEELRKERREAVHTAIQGHGLTEPEYNWITFVVSSNEDRRVAFERILLEARTGEPAPPPGNAPPPPF